MLQGNQRCRIMLCRLQSLQAECLQALETQRMPTIRNEEYRYTDVSLLLRSNPQVLFCNLFRVLLHTTLQDSASSHEMLTRVPFLPGGMRICGA